MGPGDDVGDDVGDDAGGRRAGDDAPPFRTILAPFAVS